MFNYDRTTLSLDDLRAACKAAGYQIITSTKHINICDGDATVETNWNQYPNDLYGLCDAYVDVRSRYGEVVE